VQNDGRDAEHPNSNEKGRNDVDDLFIMFTVLLLYI